MQLQMELTTNTTAIIMESGNLIVEAKVAPAIKKMPDNVSRGKVSYSEVLAERSSL